MAINGIQIAGISLVVGHEWIMAISHPCIVRQAEDAQAERAEVLVRDAQWQRHDCSEGIFFDGTTMGFSGTVIY